MLRDIRATHGALHLTELMRFTGVAEGAASLELRDGRTVVWGSAEESGAKAEVLAALLEQPGATYDVSVPSQPTIRR